MSAKNEFTRVSLAAASTIFDNGRHQLSVYLPPDDHGKPVLYRQANSGLSTPDLQRLAVNGVQHFYVNADELPKLETRLEQCLGHLLSQPDITPEDKSQVMYQVGTSITRGLVKGGVNAETMHRSAQMIDTVIETVLRDTQVAAHMLRMADHERTTASHMFIVSALSVMLGCEVLGSDREMLRALGLAGMMHDMGKLAISADILNKRGKLTPEEFQLIYQHPIESVRLLADDPHVTPFVRQMILQHHERIDGKGYPLGLRDDEIFHGSKILAIADSFHAMISRRPYRQPLTPVEALKAMNTQSGHQFDADILKVWNNLIERNAEHVNVLWLSEMAPSEELSTRHEHRAAEGTRPLFGPRPRRFRCDEQVSVKCIYAGRLADATCAPDEFLAPLQDLSRGGLSFDSPFPMYRGEVIHVGIQKHGEDSWVRGTIAWCRYCESTRYRVGVRFVRRISQDEVRRTVDVERLSPPTAPTASAPRAFFETNGNGAGLKQSPANTTMKKRNEAPTKETLMTIPPVRPKETQAIPTTAPQAIEALERILKEARPDRSAERLAVQLAKFSDVEVRLKAVEALFKIGTRPARASLTTLIDDENVRIKIQAIGAAGALKMHEAQYSLRKVLQDQDKQLALRAAGALGKIEDDVGLSVVVKALANDDELGRLAAQSFGEIVGQRFAANMEGLRSARRYLDARKRDLGVVV